MNKLFALISLAFVILFTACTPTTITNRAASPFVQRLDNVTVALVWSDMYHDKYTPYCTGVWVEHKRFITAAHCIKIVARVTAAIHQEDPDLVEALDWEGTKLHFAMYPEIDDVEKEPFTLHLATAVKVDKDLDLAIVEADGNALPEHEVAELASQSPAVGEKVFIVGHTQGMYYSYVEGVVAAYRNDLSPHVDTKGPFMQVSCAAHQGNSGGGAFDKDGKLVGIADALMPFPGATIFLHAETIRKFLLPSEKPNPLKEQPFSIPPA